MEKGFQFLKKGLLSGVKVLNSIIYDAISPSLLLLFWTLSEALYLFALLNSFYFTFKIENQAAAFLDKTLNLFTFAFYRDLQSAQSPSKIPPLQYLIPALTFSTITALPFLHKQAASKQSLGTLSKAILIIFLILIFLSTPLVFYLLDTAFSAFQNSLTPQALLSLGSASIFCLIIYCFEKLGTEVHYHDETSTLATYNQSTPLIKISKILISVALTKCSFLSISTQVWLLTIFTLLLLFEIKSLLSYRKYMNAMLQKVYEVILVSQIASLLLILLCHAGLAEVNLNFEATLLVIIVLSVRSLQTFQKWRRSKLIIDRASQPTEASAVSEVLQVIRALLFHEGSSNSQSQLTKAYIFQNHRMKCEDPSCYCKSNSKEVNPERINVVIKQQFQEKIKALPNSHSLRLIQLGFNAKQHSAVLTTLISLQRFTQRTAKDSLSLQDSLIISEIFDSLASKFVYEKDSLPSNVRCEHIFQEQTLKKNISSLLIDLLNDFISKYKYLSSQAYHLNVVEEHSVKICKKICCIDEEWRRFQSMDSSNYQIYQIFIFYHLNVLPTVLEGRAIASEIIKKFQKLSSIKGLGKQTIHSRLYSKNTCIVESNIQESFGVITNISSSSAEVFGYRSLSLIGKHVNTIMPMYFSKAHDEAIADWVDSFKLSDNQKEIIEFGYIDAKLVCFQGSLLMKVCAKLNEVFFYTMIIRENDEDYLLLNSKKVIEGVGKRLLSKRLFESSSVSQPVSDYFEFNFDEKLAQSTRVKSWLSLESSISYNFNDDDCHQLKGRETRYLFQCSVTISKLHIYHEHYFLIKFEEIIRSSSSSGKFKDSKIKDSNQSKSHPWEVQSYQRTKAEQMFDMDEYDSVQPIKERILNTKIMGDHSSASTVSNSAGPASKLLFSVKAYLIHPERIRLGFFKPASIGLFICGLLVIGFFYGLQTIFSSGFGSFNDVMFGDGAVSDNNQIYEMLYNNILMGKIYCKGEESARCAYLKKSTASVSNILYRLYVDDLEVYLKNVSMLTKTKFYESFEIKVPFRVGDTTTEVKTLQFMEYYYYAIRKSYLLITEGRDDSPQGEETMSILYDNWEAMKYINHNAIYFYMDIGEQELNLLLAFVLVLALGLLGLILGIFFIVLKFNRYLNSKKYAIMSLHVSIDHKAVLEMLDYYGFLVDIVKSHKFKTPHFFNSDQTIKLGSRRMPYATGKSRILQVLVLLIIIFLFVAIEIAEIATLLPSCKKMVKLINDLMDTENFLLENYFEMKTYYMAYNYSKSVEQITREISTHLNQSEPVFTSKAKESLNIFASTDPAFVVDFNMLLVDNICSLTSWGFEEWGVEYCNFNFTYSIMELGLVNSMVFFQRNAYSALMELYSKQKESIDKVDYFTSAVFRDIDDSLFYMFRLYQATQARMYQSLNYSISTSLVLLQLINALSVAAIFGFSLWWLCGHGRTQKDLKYLYGVILQLPEGLISNKEVKTCITESLQIQQ